MADKNKKNDKKGSCKNGSKSKGTNTSENK